MPSAAVVVEEVEPVTPAATLRNRIRPVVGGLQINFPGFLSHEYTPLGDPVKSLEEALSICEV